MLYLRLTYKPLHYANKVTDRKKPLATTGVARLFIALSLLLFAATNTQLQAQVQTTYIHLIANNSYCSGDTITFGYLSNNVSTPSLIGPNGLNYTSPPFNSIVADTNMTGWYVITARDINNSSNILRDSVYITIQPSPTIDTIITVCSYYFWGTTLFMSSGDYTFFQQAPIPSECHTIVSLHLTITLPPAVNHTPDTVIFPGQSVTLSASGADILAWYDASSDILSATNEITVTPQRTSCYYVVGYSEGASVVANGDFESGNTQFSTSYSYSTNLAEGYYYIGRNAHSYHPNFLSWRDHTSGSGYYMIVNGATSANTNLWSQTVTVQPLTVYAFSVWGCNLVYCPPEDNNCPAKLQFKVNNSQVGGIFHVPHVWGSWERYYHVWFSGLNNTANITILNQNTTGNGNDFGIDDIRFAPVVCPTADSVYVYVISQDSLSLCTDQLPYSWNNITIPGPGTYFDTLTDIHGLDSIVMVSISIKYTVYDTIQATICDNESYTFQGIAYTSPGYHSALLHTIGGCDSILTLDLAINATSYHDSAITVCNSYLWHNDAYTTDTVLTDHFVNSQGCDSSLNLHLAITNSSNSTVYITACDSYTWHDNLFSYSTTALFDTINAEGCDSTAELQLTVYYSTTTELTDSFCVGSEYFFGGHTYDIGGRYYDTLATSMGCDSILAMNLIMHNIPTVSLSQNDECSTLNVILHAHSDAHSFLWEAENEEWNPIWGSQYGNELHVPAERPMTFNITVKQYETSICKGYGSISIEPVIYPTAMMDVNPSSLSYEQLTFQAISRSLMAESQQWYIDNIPYSTSPQITYTASPQSDSTALALVALNGVCSDTALRIIPIRKQSIFTPNVITPQVSTNNKFSISLQGVVEYELFIYNRSGLLVFHSTDSNETWDGTYQGNYCPQDSYVWVVRYRSEVDPQYWHTDKGTVTIIY